MIRLICSVTIFYGVLLASVAEASVVVTIESPGVQQTTLSLAESAVETFDTFTTGYKSRLIAPFGGGALGGTYTTTFVNVASQYGGAGGFGKYNYVGTTSTLTISGGSTNYFGLWATSLDGGNTASFFKAGTNVGLVRLVDYLLPAAYKGNLTTPYLGRNSSQIYAYFNFVIPGGYDRVDLIQNGGGGFENDNQTIGNVSPIPEPASWLLLTAGFGLVGVRLRIGKRPALLRAG